MPEAVEETIFRVGELVSWESPSGRNQKIEVKTLKVDIENFNGAKNVHFEYDPSATTLVAGRNYAGKTSTFLALQSLLSGNKTPTKRAIKEAKTLVTYGAEQATATISGDKREVNRTIVWKGEECLVSCNGINLSPYAVGLVRLGELDKKPRADALIELLAANVLEHDLVDAWPDSIGKEVFEAYWKIIKKDGWEKAAKKAQEDGVYNKRRFAEITKRAWSDGMIDKWMPKPEREKYLKLDPKTLNSSVKESVKALENAIRAEAVALYDMDKLREQAAAAEKRKEEADQIAKECSQLKNPRLAIVSYHSAHACPECGVMLRADGQGNLKRESEVSGPQLDPEELNNFYIKEADLKLAYENALKAYEEAMEAGRKIAKAASLPKGLKSQHSSEAAGLALQKAEELRDKRENIALVEELDQAVRDSIAVGKLLAPDGIRQKKLADKIKTLNGVLENIAESIGWPVVRIEPESLEIYYGDRKREEYVISESEIMRTDLMLQIMATWTDGGQFIMFERAEVLDPIGRAELFKFLAKNPDCGAVVFMTAGRPDQVPNLEAKGVGKTYWLEGGTISPITSLEKEAAI